MAGRIDEVEEVFLAVVRVIDHRYRMALDGDAALALQVHCIERLLLQLAQGHGLRQLEDAVAERRLAVVDMRDDAEVSDVV